MSLFYVCQCDQTKEGVVNNSNQMDDFCKEKGFIGWFETSAKENINIDDSARFLVQRVSRTIYRNTDQIVSTNHI